MDNDVAGPQLTVVTVCRDDLSGLERTWTSIQDQCIDYEWVVVDGASADGTVRWLGDLRDPRVRASSANDRGIYDAMNKGLTKSKGGLILFLNAGDTLHDSDALARALDSHRRVGWAWAYGRIAVVAENGDPLREARFEPFRPWLLQAGYRAVPHQATFFETAFHRRLGGYRLDVGLAADQELMLRAASVAQPHLLQFQVANFAAGGATWGRQPDVFVRESAKMRRLGGSPLLGNWAADRLATEVMSIDKRARTWIRRRLLGDQVRW